MSAHASEGLGVLVTGATTPIGQALVRRLLDHEGIRCVLATGVEEPPSWFGSLAGERFRYQTADLTRPRQIRRLLFGPTRELGLQALIHMAQHRRATETGEKIHRLNVESTRMLLQLAEQHPTLKRWVFRSYGEIYRVTADLPDLIEETHPLDLSRDTPQWLRDRIEADLTVGTWMGLSSLHIVILRCAECLAPDSGSQLYDYLTSRVCFRPLGYDPMINVLSVPDLVEAHVQALLCTSQGTYNIPGKDTLPLSRAIGLAQKLEVPMPGPLLTPLYWARSKARNTDFRYDLNKRRFHFNGVLDGRRAQREMGYTPRHPIDWGALVYPYDGESHP